MDGKHVVLQCPQKSGSFYFNYKGTFSIVLLAVVDADYKFRYVDVGCNGRISDGGVFKNSSLYGAIKNKTLNIPPPRVMEDNCMQLPYVIVADDAFPLSPNIMKPYPFRNLSVEKRIYNYRLSRARRIVENAFGILSRRFQIFLSPMKIQPERAEKVILLACALHNLMEEDSRSFSKNFLTNTDIIDKCEGKGWLPLTSYPMNSSNDAKKTREAFCTYFNTVGAVPWQNNCI